MITPVREFAAWLSYQAFRMGLRTLPRASTLGFEEDILVTFRDGLSGASARGVKFGLQFLLFAFADLGRRAVSERVSWRRKQSVPPQPPRRSFERLVFEGRDALRTVWRRPAYSIAVVATLALVIGGNTAVFGVVYSTLLRPLPFEESERLVMIGRVIPQFDMTSAPVSLPDFGDWRDQSDVFEAMAGYAIQEATYRTTDEAERWLGVAVTREFFSTLGASPHIGRTTPAADSDGDRRVVLSAGTWIRRFGADTNIIGQTIRLDDLPRTVVGVMPSDFTFPGRSVQFWTALPPEADQWDRTTNRVVVFGRLRPGVDLKSAGASLQALVGAIDQAHPEMLRRWPGYTVALESFLEAEVGDVRQVLWMLLGSALCIFLIACANLANLTMARGTLRQRELAIRAVMGAGRARLVRQLAGESLLLALIGGALGILVAHGLTDYLQTLAPSSLPRREEIGLAASSLVFTFVASLLSTVFFGLLPALRVSRSGMRDGLVDGGRGGGFGHRSLLLLRWLAGSQFALALMLLIGGGLLMKSLINLLAVDPGFNAQNGLAFHVDLPRGRYDNRDAVYAYFDDLRARVGAVPGVLSVASTSTLPFARFLTSRIYVVEHETVAVGEEPTASNIIISPGYFRVMEIPVIQGRAFAETDIDGGLSVAIINQAMARLHWPDGDVVGKRFRYGGADESSPWITVVGLVPDVALRSLANPPAPTFYRPHEQVGWLQSSYLVVRSNLEAESLAPAIRAATWSIDATLPVTDMATLDDRIALSVAGPRFETTLMVAFSVMAGLIAIVGVYGVMTFLVTSRWHEMGVRMALGARSGVVVVHVLRQAGTVIVLGMVCGWLGAWGLAGVLDTMLFGVASRDASVFVVVGAVLGAMGILASWIPALRAGRADPMMALRG